MIKNLTLMVLLVTAVATTALGQLRTPQPSPSAKLTQTIGLTEVTVEYSRPGVKGRTIFGDLVPYDKIWRTGANQVSKISFGDDVTINGNALAKGSYAILTKPGMKTWDVHFYAYESGNWSSYVEKTPALAVTAPAVAMPDGVIIENFTIGFDGLHNNGGNMEMMWEGVFVPLEIGVNAHETVMANMKKLLSGPSDQDYYAAGSYLLETDQDLEKALMYVQKVTHSETPRFWQVRREALILSKLGRKAEAVKAAQKSLDLAKTAGNDDYVRMNEKSIKEWSM